ncbi:MAG: RimK family protein [Planctomycetales bacterium]|nr:RimK family protein [Planctomycetales bacterium]
MKILLVTHGVQGWPTNIPDAEVVDAKEYLTNPRYSELRGAKVYNLCRSYRYQSTGYYVSLLAEARGHKPVPNITTAQDIKTQAIVRMVADDLLDLIQRSLAPLHSDSFELSIYFGCNMAKRYSRLALRLFNQFQSPLMRAHFTKSSSGWQLRRITTISGNDVPEKHWPFVIETAKKHFSSRSLPAIKRAHVRYDMAILQNPDDPEPPSDAAALKKFCKIGAAMGIAVELIDRDDYGRIAEFDALFIRDTTRVNHYTYRFAQRAENEGLVVMDDPLSIVRCSNKVYLAELLTRHKVPVPKSLVVEREQTNHIAAELGFPLVLKKPDSAFSQGVVKVRDQTELDQRLAEFFAESDLIVVQAYLPTTFDWRIGVLDQKPLFACKYFMARGHWQIIRPECSGTGRYGKFETMAVDEAPAGAVKVALKAANLIGNGLYGVDVKESAGRFYVIEVNDNPNIDSKVEDIVLKNELYRRVLGVFLERIERSKAKAQ